jgi:hypothetical protein
MGISRCLDVGIGKLPPEAWGAEIAKLPEVCPHPGDCTVRVGCREYVARYYRMQWHLRRNRERLARKRGATHDAG